MAFTQADIDKLERAIADGAGARSITFSDQSITFNSLEEMWSHLARMRTEVATATGRPRTRYAATSKGTC